MTTAAEYSALITAQHRNKPKFRAMVEAVAECFSGAGNTCLSIPPAFDLDSAVGAQLDVIGLWVGASREIRVPFAVYFSFDTDGLGFDQGSIKGHYDPSEGVSRLDDETYRTLIRAKIAANSWDGTINGWQSVMDRVFAGQEIRFFAVDNQDMTMDIYIVGKVSSALQIAMISGGYLQTKPSGVQCSYQMTSVFGAPVFGFDVQNEYVGGFDFGAFAIPAVSISDIEMPLIGAAGEIMVIGSTSLA